MKYVFTAPPATEQTLRGAALCAESGGMMRIQTGEELVQPSVSRYVEGTGDHVLCIVADTNASARSLKRHYHSRARAEGAPCSAKKEEAEVFDILRKHTDTLS